MIVLGLSFSDNKLFADTGSLSVLLSGQICTSRALSALRLGSQVKLLAKYGATRTEGKRERGFIKIYI